ncbi:winged helix-turn-helix domain-containing protein [Streptomyces sp. NPDC017890]|uniref:winged helix-turn-helix domain-containing protein n=1 Tax=Streptomyces sp. NPDC017890 TaxID=3365015 RepID=UPI0037A089C9
MTTALPAQTTPHDPASSDAPRLRLVGDATQRGPQELTPAPLVAYLVLVPEGTDPAELFVKDRPRPEIRPAGAAVPASDRRTGDDAVRIDPARRVAEVNGHELDLTYLEFELLAHIVQHPHHVHSRDGLVAAVWGYDHVGDGRTVDVHIARLRRKLGEAHRHRIVTVRSVGYKYVPDQQESPDAAFCGRP